MFFLSRIFFLFHATNIWDAVGVFHASHAETFEQNAQDFVRFSLLFLFQFHFPCVFFGEFGEEVALQHDGEAHQQVGVDPLALKDVVERVAVDVKLPAQPLQFDAVAVDMLLDSMPDVEFLFHASSL